MLDKKGSETQLSKAKGIFSDSLVRNRGSRKTDQAFLIFGFCFETRNEIQLRMVRVSCFETWNYKSSQFRLCFSKKIQKRKFLFRSIFAFGSKNVSLPSSDRRPTDTQVEKGMKGGGRLGEDEKTKCEHRLTLKSLKTSFNFS